MRPPYHCLRTGVLPHGWWPRMLWLYFGTLNTLTTNKTKDNKLTEFASETASSSTFPKCPQNMTASRPQVNWHSNVTTWMGEDASWSLQWGHNERDGVSNYEPHVCLLDCLFRRRSRKHQSPAPLVFVRGIHRWPVNSPHKGPVTRKMFPFDDFIMVQYIMHGWRLLTSTVKIDLGGVCLWWHLVWFRYRTRIGSQCIITFQSHFSTTSI